jgi:ribonucleoside-diphosphate reductase beta chain
VLLTVPLFRKGITWVQDMTIKKIQTNEDFYEKQMLLFWRPNEIDVTKDRGDFKIIIRSKKFIFTKNLGYQILLDSIQSRVFYLYMIVQI